MRKLFAVTTIVGTMIVGFTGMALAADGDDRGDRDSDRHHERAPEPLTIAGLALGASSIGGAAFWARRSRRGKR